MRSTLLMLLCLSALFASAYSLAAESALNESAGPSISKPGYKFDEVRFEIGAAAGFPTILGVQFGVWGSDDFPFLIRASSGIGSQMDLGVHLELDSRNCNDRLIVAASGGIIGYGWGGNSVLGEMGLIAGMRLGHFSFQAGPAIYFGGSLYSPMIGAHGSMAFTALY